jgi:hypothetical protein
LVSPQSRAATLTLYTTWNLDGRVVLSSDGSPVIVPTLPPTYPPLIPAAPGFAAGAMEVAGDSLSFSLSMFGDTSPFVALGSYGPSSIPVRLEIDELTVTGSGTFRSFDPLGGVYLAPDPGTGTVRGSVTVGTTTVPFNVSAPAQWGSDGVPPGAMGAGVIPGPPERGILGDISYGYGGFIGSGAAMDVVSLPAVDGVTFDLSARVDYWGLAYVPEPSAAALLAAALCLALTLRARSAGAARRSSALGRGTP